MVAAEIGDVDVGGLQLGDERAIVLLAGREGLVHDLLQAGRIHRLLGLVGEAFAVGGLVVQDRDVLALELRRQILAGDAALLVVAAADAEHVGAGALVGQLRIGRGRRDLDDAFVRVDLGGGDRGARAEVARRRGAPCARRACRPPRPPAWDRRRRPRCVSDSFLPLTPPAALMSATAISAPALNCAPNEAYWPVIGPIAAIGIVPCAHAQSRQGCRLLLPR